MPLRRTIHKALCVIAHCEPNLSAPGLGRSLIALAELSVIVFTPDNALFAPAAESPAGISCVGLKRASLWCLSDSTSSSLLARIVSILILALVASGYRPRWTCLPHLYVAFSVNASITQPNGGDRFSQVAALLLAPLCLSDSRVWHWSHLNKSLPQPVSGSGYAAIAIIRVQVLIIYVGAACAKLADPAWRDGTALQIIVNDPIFGAPAILRQHLAFILDTYWPLALVTWAVIGTELAIGLAMILSWRWRRRARLAGTALHVSIIIMLGLPSFGLVMIGILMIAEGGRPLHHLKHRERDAGKVLRIHDSILLS